MFDLRSLEAADAALSALAAASCAAIGATFPTREREADAPKNPTCPHLARLDGGRRPS